MIWVLYICAGVSWMGCDRYFTHEMPDKKTCFEALKEIKVEKYESSLISYCAIRQDKQPATIEAGVE